MNLSVSGKPDGSLYEKVDILLEKVAIHIRLYTDLLYTSNTVVTGIAEAKN